MAVKDLIELTQVVHKQGKISNIFTDKNGVNSEIKKENKLLYRVISLIINIFDYHYILQEYKTFPKSIIL